MSRLGRALCWGIPLLVGLAQEHGHFGKGRSATIPRGIEVSVQPAGRGAPLTLSSNTHAAVSTVGNESWNTFATLEVPAAGAYRVTVLDPGDNGDSRHSITIGKGPWAPMPPWRSLRLNTLHTPSF